MPIVDMFVRLSINQPPWRVRLSPGDSAGDWSDVGHGFSARRSLTKACCMGHFVVRGDQGRWEKVECLWHEIRLDTFEYAPS